MEPDTPTPQDKNNQEKPQSFIWEFGFALYIYMLSNQMFLCSMSYAKIYQTTGRMW